MTNQHPPHVSGTIHRAADLDADYERAIGIMVRANRVSTSFVSRSMGIGYNAAARLVERAEADGIVTRPNEVGKRSIAAIQPDPQPVASEPLPFTPSSAPASVAEADGTGPTQAAQDVLAERQSGRDKSARKGGTPEELDAFHREKSEARP